jgi:hypothetical protein
VDEIATVLHARYGGKSWCYNHSGYDGLHWTDATPKPTLNELITQYNDVVAEQRAARAAHDAARASGIAKLAALGLTETEIAALL